MEMGQIQEAIRRSIDDSSANAGDHEDGGGGAGAGLVAGAGAGAGAGGGAGAGAGAGVGTVPYARGRKKPFGRKMKRLESARSQQGATRTRPVWGTPATSASSVGTAAAWSRPASSGAQSATGAWNGTAGGASAATVGAGAGGASGAASGSAAKKPSRSRKRKKKVFATASEIADAGLCVDRDGHIGVNVIDCEDGTYKCDYTPSRVASVEEWKLEVILNERHIAGSPFTVHVHPGPKTSSLTWRYPQTASAGTANVDVVKIEVWRDQVSGQQWRAVPNPKSKGPGDAKYWYNIVTREVQWIHPMITTGQLPGLRGWRDGRDER